MTGLDDYLAGLRAAAEPTRLRLLALCAEGELTVSELTEILGQSQPRVSRHLKLLVEAGLLERIREGTWAFYRLTGGDAGTRLGRRLVDMIPADDAALALDRERLGAVKQARAGRAQAYFRKNAARWNKIRKLYIGEAEVEKALLEAMPMEGVDDFLDIGTGTGRILELFGGEVDRGLGIDLSREMLALARTNLERAGLGNCRVRHGDMYKLPLPSASFDAAAIHQVLHYADHPAAAIAEAARVLRPGGRLAIVDFAPHDLEFLRLEHAHRRLGFSDDEVKGWCRAAGLVPEGTVRLPGDPLTVLIWTVRRSRPGRSGRKGGRDSDR